MKIKDRIAEIVILREELANEIKTLQASCPHDEYHIGTFSWRIGSYDNKRICLECGEVLGNPSDSEIGDFNSLGRGTKIYKKA